MEIYKIYTLSCPITNDIRYIGRTQDTLSSRLSKHIYERNKNKNHRCHWINNLYKQNLKPKIELIESTDDIKLFFLLETYWIYQFKAWGFNLVNETFGGEGSIGYKHTPETLLKLKIYYLNNKKVLKPKKILMSKEEKRIFQSNKMSIPILQYSLEGDFIKEWKSITLAAKYYKVWVLAIIFALKNNNKKSVGFLWRYKENEVKLNIDNYIPTSNKIPIKLTDTLENKIIIFNSTTEMYKYLGCRIADIKVFKDKNNLYKKRYKIESVCLV